MELQDVNVLLVSSRHSFNVDMRDQLGGREVVHGSRRYRFFYPGEIEEPDVVAVRNKTLREKMTVNVAPENTILLLSEPRSVFDLPRSYCRQFATLYSCQEESDHPNTIFGPAFLSWLVGIRRVQGRGGEMTHSCESLRLSPLPSKTKLISVVTSNRAITRGHVERMQFVAALKAHFGDRLDVFGRGFRPFEDKWDVLADYKYHIALENSSSRYYWTEKLSDAYLAGCLPIYYGCSNVDDYFPAESLVAIDVHDPVGAISKIEDLLARDPYESARPILEECKRRVLTDYNAFEILASVCDRLDVSRPKRQVSLSPAGVYLDKVLKELFVQNFWKSRYWWLKKTGQLNL